MVKMTKVERIINAEVRSGGSGGSGEETPVRAVVIRGTTEVEGKLALSLSLYTELLRGFYSTTIQSLK